MNGLSRAHCALFYRSGLSASQKKNQPYSPNLFFLSLAGAILFLISNFSLTYGQGIQPAHEMMNVEDVAADYDGFSTFDIHAEILYGHDGNQVVVLDLATGEQINSFSAPDGYTAFPSFLKRNPWDGKFWAGYTVTGNTDDRIYTLDTDTGEWEWVASFAGNHDIVFFEEDVVLVSGLNSNDWNLPSSVFVLDISGNNLHRKIIEIGGTSAGLSNPADGSICYGTYYFTQQNYLYRWHNDDVVAAIESEGNTVLTPDDATILSTLPAGSYDTHSDGLGNIFLTLNGSEKKMLVKWNGNTAHVNTLDTLAVATGDFDWLTYVRTTGDYDLHGPDNAVYTLSWGNPVQKAYRKRAPQFHSALPVVQLYDSYSSDVMIDLSDYYSDPDGEGVVEYSIVYSSFPEVVDLTLENSILTLDYQEQGQTEVLIRATSSTGQADASVIVGTSVLMPVPDMPVSTANFENLSLSPESFWNGSDETGYFISEDIVFPNSYNTEYGSWAGWAYSNITDNMTPGWENQYSAITGESVAFPSGESENYAVSFVSGKSFIHLENQQMSDIYGLYLTNTTYAALDMKNGGGFSKKFGGEDGTDPDWFKVIIATSEDPLAEEMVEFYLADFRFEDHTKDYIIQTWQWVDLSMLPDTDTLWFELASSDVGDFGMNTPAYFAADNIIYEAFDVGINPRVDNDNLLVYPNPSNGVFNINNTFSEDSYLDVFNQLGEKVMTRQMKNGDNLIDLTGMTPGIYILRINSPDHVFSRPIILQ